MLLERIEETDPEATVAPYTSPVTTFTQFTVPVAEGSWRKGSLESSPGANAAEIQSVLQNIYSMQILGDWWTNAPNSPVGWGIKSQEFTYLDNVILTGPTLT